MSTMPTLAGDGLRVDLLDPAVGAPRQGSRYCWGGYIWQVHDGGGPLVAGPQYPDPAPTAFNGQGLPESFRHRTRDGRNLTWSPDGRTGLGVGIGRLAAGPGGEAEVVAPCRWAVSAGRNSLEFCTQDAADGLAYGLTRHLEVSGRTLVSSTDLTNTGRAPLELQWFAHPFFALTGGQLTARLPAGCRLPENPGFALEEGTLSFRRPFLTEADNQFALLETPPGVPLAVTLSHPRLASVGFATDFAPDECPVWANAHTFSIEPYLNLRLAPGEHRRWRLRYDFGAAMAAGATAPGTESSGTGSPRGSSRGPLRS